MQISHSPRAITGAVVLCLTLSFPANRLNAQATAAAAIAFGGVDKILSRIESIDLYYGWSMMQPKQGPGGRYRVPSKTEYGLEFSMHVGSYGDTTDDYRASLAKDRAEAFAKAGAKTKADSAAVLAAAKWKINGLTVKKHVAILGEQPAVTAVDSEFVAVRPEPKEVERDWDMDFALGYGQVDGLKRYDPYEFRGYVRELPSVSLYMTRWMPSGIGLYVGARTGVITLQDGQLYVPAIPAAGSSPAVARKTYSVSATTYEMGGAIGAAIPLWGSSEGTPTMTFEFTYMRRNFNSIQVSGSDTLPADALHSLDLTGGNLSIGLMFPIPKASK